ncbi:hypothetical protein NDI52_01815, partial [Leptolyngbya sp. PL-A3]
MKLRLHHRVVLASTIALSGVSVCALTARAMYRDSPKAVVDQAWQIVNRDYVDPNFNQVDWQEVRYSLLDRNLYLGDEQVNLEYPESGSEVDAQLRYSAWGIDRPLLLP